MLFTRPRGTQDVLPSDVESHLFLENAARRIFNLFGFFEMRAPIIESAALFARSLGSVTDVVEKQMFIIKKEDGDIALRPEGTAGVVRAYVENGLDKSFPSGKFFYIGPMFRGERPQKGRLRQFHHIGCESISGAMPAVDIEVILLLDMLMKEIGLGDYQLKINTIGCEQDKLNISKVLYEFLSGKRESLCDDCQRRLDKNVFRVLDCKKNSCKAIAKEAVNRINVCGRCKAHFDAVVAELDRAGINYIIDPLLVRGLDYYTRTVFELTHPNLSSGQDAIGAGGRYDNLVSEISGGKIDKGAVGFALGVERLLLCLNRAGEIKCPQVVVAYQDASLLHIVIDIARQVRAKGISCDYDLRHRSLKAQMRRAGKLGAKYVIIIGEQEASSGSFTLKEMSGSKQITGLSRENLLDKISLKS